MEENRVISFTESELNKILEYLSSRPLKETYVLFNLVAGRMREYSESLNDVKSNKKTGKSGNV